MSSRLRSRAAAPLLAAVLAACSGEDGARGAAAACPEGSAAWSNAGGFYAVWRPLAEPAEVPLNEEFEAEVWLFTDDSCAVPVEGAEVAIDCRMPAHRHGMLHDVALEHRGGGRYVAEGMLCHMTGRWELHVDLTRGALTERAQFDFVLE